PRQRNQEHVAGALLAKTVEHCDSIAQISYFVAKFGVLRHHLYGSESQGQFLLDQASHVISRGEAHSVDEEIKRIIQLSNDFVECRYVYYDLKKAYNSRF